MRILIWSGNAMKGILLNLNMERYAKVNGVLIVAPKIITA
jgi:hypothetical protein